MTKTTALLFVSLAACGELNDPELTTPPNRVVMVSGGGVTDDATTQPPSFRDETVDVPVATVPHSDEPTDAALVEPSPVPMQPTLDAGAPVEGSGLSITDGGSAPSVGEPDAPIEGLNGGGGMNDQTEPQDPVEEIDEPTEQTPDAGTNETELPPTETATCGPTPDLVTNIPFDGTRHAGRGDTIAALDLTVIASCGFDATWDYLNLSLFWDGPNGRTAEDFCMLFQCRRGEPLLHLEDSEGRSVVMHGPGDVGATIVGTPMLRGERDDGTHDEPLIAPAGGDSRLLLIGAIRDDALPGTYTVHLAAVVIRYGYDLMATFRAGTDDRGATIVVN